MISSNNTSNKEVIHMVKEVHSEVGLKASLVLVKVFMVGLGV